MLSRLSILLLLASVGCTSETADIPPAFVELSVTEQTRARCESGPDELPPPSPSFRAGLDSVSSDVEEERLEARTTEWAERVLSEAEAVVGSSGPWNAPSPHAAAFRVIQELPSDSAAVSFQRIYENAHAAGQIYALAGLRQAGASGAAALMDGFANNRDWVLVWQYDEISCVRTGDFVSGSDTGWPPDIASGSFATWLQPLSPAP